eukprot:CAMPEP_0113948730 /NCGR_PEP_ID=MMETSP1339-20121228/71737_1 /TAXON_ID=94617 /ORGANISM="Fibrocapsa japonica" /LENGTH=135 /DNA_ID=CAMNT_0000955879 /DNA_START=14 /DNA_END=423 /DNA_ORIENTATION=+ /assembly_acc=CAM_ASM_000762
MVRGVEVEKRALKSRGVEQRPACKMDGERGVWRHWAGDKHQGEVFAGFKQTLHNGFVKAGGHIKEESTATRNLNSPHTRGFGGGQGSVVSTIPEGSSMIGSGLSVGSWQTVQVDPRSTKRTSMTSNPPSSPDSRK